MNVNRGRFQNNTLAVYGGHQDPFLIFGQAVGNVQNRALLICRQKAITDAVSTAVGVLATATQFLAAFW